MKSKPFLTFYNQIGFAATATGDPGKVHKLEVLKNELYENLGIQDNLIQFQNVLEIGPGSGENVFRILGLSPKSLSILDGSPAVLSNLRLKISEQDNCGITLILGDANEYSSEIKYDLIIAEGVLPFQNNPIQMLENILRLLRVGGTIIVTTNDEFSTFSEVCRRYISKRIFKNLEYSQGKVKLLVNFFSKDLLNLHGMTRNHEDWVIDSIINPWKGKLFSIKDVLQIQNLKLLRSSPNFYVDWRWYKDPTFLDHENTILKEIQTYSKECINFLDQRYIVEPIEIDSYKSLSDLLSDFYFATQDYVLNDGKYSKNDFELFINDLLCFSKMFHKGTSKSLNALLQWSKSDDIDQLEDFRHLWGRGQQFLSLKKSNDDK